MHTIVPGRYFTYVINFKMTNGNQNYDDMRPHRYTKILISSVVTEQMKQNLFKLMDKATQDEMRYMKNHGD